MLTNIIKALLVIAGCAVAEVFAAAVVGGATTHGLIAFGFVIILGAYEFSRYVDKWAKVKEAINDLAAVIPMQELQRLAPLANNPDLVADFLQAYGVENQATVSNLQQQLATLQKTNSDLQNKLKQVANDYEATISHITATAKQTQSNLERKLSELTLRLSDYKAKYEILETGTDREKAEHLRNMYFSIKNKINAAAKNNGKL